MLSSAAPASLPAPGPQPLAGPARDTIAILIIITLACLWLMHQGLQPVAALGVVAGIGLVSVEIAARFVGASALWLPRLSASLTHL
ncbi:hypothetical protein ACWCOT_24365 [Nonomuraea bangladeshensis]